MYSKYAFEISKMKKKMFQKCNKLKNLRICNVREKSKGKLKEKKTLICYECI
jgi:hypothetical protein